MAAAFASTHSASADGYRLSVGDVVSFDFLDDALPAEQLTVASDGQVNVPLIGGFSVAGLTGAEAREAIRTSLIERQFFIDPQISLAVASFRPIFVLGDVKAPGSFPFQPLLTVEHAVALAGGQSTGGVTAEDRIVMQTRLRGELRERQVEITRESVAAARLTAQLANRAEVLDSDLPPKARPVLDAELIEALLATERQILSAEKRAFVTRRDQLTAAVAEVKGALANLEQLAEKQKGVIASAQSELDRAKALSSRGLKTLTELSGVERDTTAQEAHLLGIYNQMSTTRRELGDLQRQLADLADNRTRAALSDLQAHNAEIERLLVVRASTEEQIALLGTLTTDAERGASSLTFAYQIRRKVDGRVVTYPAILDDPLLSGDTVLVSMADPKSGAGVPIASAALDAAP